jgi:hypothetical protein
MRLICDLMFATSDSSSVHCLSIAVHIDHGLYVRVPGNEEGVPAAICVVFTHTQANRKLYQSSLPSPASGHPRSAPRSAHAQRSWRRGAVAKHGTIAARCHHEL